jgi:hypothetical protein
MTKGRPQRGDETPADTPDRVLPDDEAIRTLVTRLSRRHRSGGRVVERAAVVASGSDGDAIIAWIVAHHGRPESDVPAGAERGGLYGARAPQRVSTPQRYVLPAGALD